MCVAAVIEENLLRTALQIENGDARVLERGCGRHDGEQHGVPVR
jgi:hypothetical protein